MRASSLPKLNPSVGESKSLSSDIPSPLHIIKRTKTVEFRPSEKRETSSGSVDYGPDRPLSVMKKRQCQRPVADYLDVGDHDTPKPVKTIQAQQQPKPRAPLRWLSRRTSSTGTTRRRYNSRSCSGYSDGSSSLGYLDEASSTEASESRCSARMDTSFSSIPTPIDYGDDCLLLVPFVSITPEVITLHNGISTVWAAMEISVRLSLPYDNDMPTSQSNAGNFLSNPLRVGSVARFGTIYDLQTDVIPVPHTTVVRVIKDSQKRSLGLGSAMLILAKIRTDNRRRQSNTSVVQQSNELIADLENELGAAVVRYIQVRLRYNHSGFPVSHHAAPTEGTTDWQTRLETTVTGVIKRQALYSPSRSASFGESEGSLYNLVASYWGPLRASEIFLNRSSCPKAALVVPNPSIARGDQIMTVPGNSFASQRALKPAPMTPMPRKRVDFQASPTDHEEDPARKIWTEMRRKTSRSGRNTLTGSVNNLSLPATPMIPGRTSFDTGSLRVKTDVDRRRELIRDVALRNKRSIGADSLKSLVPSMMNLDISGKEAWGDSSSTTSNKENVPPERRKEGRWSLAGWW
ncbi:hypothetical protein F5Y08DRAFT_174041 [Xylaria arbuscula]|nr:hypothetical protein F5Y08DRAFT_174041 [Xylaria arbuscula]